MSAVILLVAIFAGLWWLGRPFPNSGNVGIQTKSTHKVEVVSIDQINPHSNADKLEIIPIFNGWFQSVVGKGEFKVGDYGAYVHPDSLVPLDREEFAFLRGVRTPKVINGREYHLIRAVKLRKEPSQGLLLKIPSSFLRNNRREYKVVVGMDLAEHFEVLHYDPPPKSQQGQPGTKGPKKLAIKPKAHVPFYDIDSLRRFSEVFEDGEKIIVTEKIHGANAAYLYEPLPNFQVMFTTFHPGDPIKRESGFTRARKGLSIRWKRTELRLSFGKPLIEIFNLPWEAVNIRVRSRTVWRLWNPLDSWWKALSPSMKDFLYDTPGVVLFGEIYGPSIQDLSYGVEPGEVKFIAFDIYDPKGREFVSQGELEEEGARYGIPVVPSIYTTFDKQWLLDLADQPSTLAALNGDPKQIREGIVVKPLNERHSPKIGRVILKIVGNKYLERGES